MNNPFSRLKHYLPDKIDPQENYATECLAACLVFSPSIRYAFIQFLSDKIKIDPSSEIEVITQLMIDNGYIDLILQQPDKFVVAVEVKVKCHEDERHREQLKKYRAWLNCENKQNKYLFTLVRNKDENFSPEHFGADGRFTWRELYDDFQKKIKACAWSDADIILARNFCEYLESDGIVTTYNMKDLLNYAAGVKARKAINGIFGQVESQLEEKENGFVVRSVEDRKDAWPQLKIQNPRWEKIFGKGENWKISLWFRVPGIWDREGEHDFYPEIELWHIDHQNDWEYVKSKLPQWLKILESKGFYWDVFYKWNKPERNIPAHEIQSQPKRVLVGKTGVELEDKELLSTDVEALVNKLTDWVKQFAEAIDSLDAS